MTDDEMRDLLAQQIAGWWVGEPGHEITAEEAAEITPGLLPVVRAIADDERAEERNRWITCLGALAGRRDMRWFALELRLAVTKETP